MGMGERGTFNISGRALALVLAIAILTGFAAGRIGTGEGVHAAATDPGATATRSAELEELNRLRTQVAQTPACTPPAAPAATGVPSSTPTPTPVPPAAMGQEVAYGDRWTVVVNTLAPAPPSSKYTPAGKLVQLGVTVTNNAAEHRLLGFDSWILVDEQGRIFQMAPEATTQLHGPDWYLGSEPSLPDDLTIVFDVTLDAGPAFVLESTSDPLFRVAVQMQVFG
ncbi:MAG: hypothetical protein QOF01_4283 [Thermomicrobiales bacterium]|jgi:hypothetical protein|nr:hypothetical protein [Thermomicrobiales bacterium]